MDLRRGRGRGRGRGGGSCIVRKVIIIIYCTKKNVPDLPSPPPTLGRMLGSRSRRRRSLYPLPAGRITTITTTVWNPNSHASTREKTRKNVHPVRLGRSPHGYPFARSPLTFTVPPASSSSSSPPTDDLHHPRRVADTHPRVRILALRPNPDERWPRHDASPTIVETEESWTGLRSDIPPHVVMWKGQ
jgi:hypothetical protein